MRRRLELHIDDDGNDAFAEDAAAEYARILFDTAARIGRGVDVGTLFDKNGNMVGTYSLRVVRGHGRRA